MDCAACVVEWQRWSPACVVLKASDQRLSALTARPPTIAREQWGQQCSNSTPGNRFSLCRDTPQPPRPDRSVDVHTAPPSKGRGAVAGAVAVCVRGGCGVGGSPRATAAAPVAATNGTEIRRNTAAQRCSSRSDAFLQLSSGSDSRPRRGVHCLLTAAQQRLHSNRKNRCGIGRAVAESQLRTCEHASAVAAVQLAHATAALGVTTTSSRAQLCAAAVSNPAAPTAILSESFLSRRRRCF